MTGDNQDSQGPADAPSGDQAGGPAGGPAGDQAGSHPATSIEETRFEIRAQYLKDISFENPNAPLIYTKLNVQPEIGVSMDVQARALEGRNFEVVLSSNVNAKFGDSQGFLVELQYCGLVQVAEGVDAQELEPLLLVEIPRFLFPFARDLISAATRDGGFPPLMINPIDFNKLYQRHKQQGGAQPPAAQPAG